MKKIKIEISESMYGELRFFQEEKKVKYGTIIEALLLAYFWANTKMLKAIRDDEIKDWNGKLEEEVNEF